MNYYYRLVAQWDEHNEYQCLNCKNNFINIDDPIYEGWKLCPFCEIRWKGQFTKCNKRYHILYSSYKETYPRLKVEVGNIVKNKLAKDGFYAISCKPYIQYVLHSHTNFNTKTWSYHEQKDRQGIAITMWKSYKNACSCKYNKYIRLLYMRSETDFDIIKEHING